MKRITRISLIITAIAAVFSYLSTTSFLLSLRYAIYDFLLLELLQIVYENYKASSSKISLAMQNNRTRELANKIVDYENQTHDILHDMLMNFYIKKLSMIAGCQNIDGVEVDIDFIKDVSGSSAEFIKNIYGLCDSDELELLNAFDYEKYNAIVVYYRKYADIKRMGEFFLRENVIDLSKVKFYRVNDDTTLNPFFVFDERYIFEIRKKGKRVVINTEQKDLQNYHNSFIAYSKKSVRFGLTQSQDSLFVNQAIKEFYGVHAKVPDLHLDVIGDIKGEILDLGTGAGRLIQCFIDRDNCHITAMDKDDAALEECRKAYNGYSDEKITYENATFDEKSFSENHFDLIVAYNSLYHTDRATLFSYIQRVYVILKKDGYFLFTLKTMDGNEEIYKDAGELYPDRPEHTYMNTKFPDYQFPHHFCDDEEIETYINMFSEVVFEEEIPFLTRHGEIVQGKGKYFILRK